MMLTFVNVIWGARCGETARRVLLGETRTRGHAYSVRRRRESACDRKAPHRLKSSRLVSTNLEIVQLDLQREFHQPRRTIASLHSIPQLPLPSPAVPAHADLSTIREAIATVRHLLQLFHAELQDHSARRKLRRLIQRLLNISRELDHVTSK